ncbi:hypothetical protein DESUT3_39440 [Desulfuromonas versatilis]|uniref:NRDE family protein n=1 Tax=Desulfuromonas versatilis TaxID=2802975 RepID=A0ABN6E3F0_9BACT|nr:NRDE family protein [Desulfuromonas versatilis]BCR06875.1 hypothetical protein DESUT3_39440 [Desulfuromonas versatilis]
MCLILFALNGHPDYPLVLAANRDEFYRRATAPAGFWEERPDLLAGRDLVEGGTWLGISRTGRLAAVTNYRDPAEWGEKRRSRGLLTSEFLLGSQSPRAYLEKVAAEADRYKGFNLLAGDGADLWYYSNRQGQLRKLEAGCYGLSNHLLDTPWPKVASGKAALERVLEAAAPARVEPLQKVLSDRSLPPDHQLPDTGVGLDWERVLASRFIVSPDYGTRSSTVLLLARDRTLTFAESTFGPGGERQSERRFVLAPGR